MDLTSKYSSYLEWPNAIANANANKPSIQASANQASASNKPPKKDNLTNWVCVNCKSTGHRIDDCTKPIKPLFKVFLKKKTKTTTKATNAETDKPTVCMLTSANLNNSRYDERPAIAMLTQPQAQTQDKGLTHNSTHDADANHIPQKSDNHINLSHRENTSDATNGPIKRTQGIETEYL